MKRMLMAMLGLLLGAATGAVAQTGADMTQTPLTLKVTQAGNLAFYDNDAIENLKYTVNGGAEQAATKGGTISGLNVDDVVTLYCNGKQSSMGNDELFDQDEDNTTIKAQVYGNPMSLLDGEGFATATAVGERAFQYLFDGDAFLANHPTNDLVLPATTLAGGCYAYMFSGCTGLTRTPKLPATTLDGYCYCGMFKGCTGLTDAYVAAPYTTSNYEMYRMFYGITDGQITVHTTADGKAAWESQTDFSFKAVLADYADGGSSETEPATDPNAPAIASVTHTPEEAEGTVTITYGTDGATLTPGETLLSAVQGKAVTVAVTPKAGYRVVGVTLENAAADEAKNVTSIAIDNAPTEALFVNSTGTLTATVSPDDATDKTVTWSSSDPDYVKIDPNTGEYTVMGTKGYGSATITATATNGTDDTSDDVTATCTITGKVTYTELKAGDVLHVGDTFYGKYYFNTSPLFSSATGNGAITVVENNGYYKFQRGSNGTMPNFTAYKVKDNTDGVYIVSGSGTSSNKFVLAVHTVQ